MRDRGHLLGDGGVEPPFLAFLLGDLLETQAQDEVDGCAQVGERIGVCGDLAKLMSIGAGVGEFWSSIWKKWNQYQPLASALT